MASKDFPEGFIERRKFFRVKLKQSLIAQMNINSVKGDSVSLKRKTEILLQDMSGTGLRFYTCLNLPVTDSIVYKFKTRLMGTDLHMKGIVKRERKVGIDIFEYGVQLIINEEEREKLIPILFKLQRVLRNHPLFSDGDFALENPISYLRKVKHSKPQSD